MQIFPSQFLFILSHSLSSVSAIGRLCASFFEFEDSHSSTAMLSQFFLFLSITNCVLASRPWKRQFGERRKYEEPRFLYSIPGICSKQEKDILRDAVFTAAAYVALALGEIDNNPGGDLFQYFFDPDSVASVRSVFVAVNSTFQGKGEPVQVRCDDLLGLCPGRGPEEPFTYIAERENADPYINFCPSSKRLVSKLSKTPILI